MILLKKGNDKTEHTNTNRNTLVHSVKQAKQKYDSTLMITPSTREHQIPLNKICKTQDRQRNKKSTN